MNDNRKKILLFDCWTKGLIHIFRLLPFLKKLNIEFNLLHTGSWGDEKGRPIEEDINGIKVFDIKKYKTFNDALDKINPDLVLFLSLDPIAHRAFNRICQFRSIKTILVYHGLHSVFNSLSAAGKTQANYIRYLMQRLKSGVIKNIHAYVKTLFETSVSFQDLIKLLCDIVYKLLGREIKISRNDGTPDHICIFNEFDESHARNKYPTCKKFYRTGLFDIEKFQGLEEKIYAEHQTGSKKKIIYIGTGLRSTNMLSADHTEYFRYLCNIQDYFSPLFEVGFKLHYSRLNKINSIASRERVSFKFINDNEFIDYVTSSAFGICEPSSASLIPALLSKPIFLPAFDIYKDLKFGPAILEYPGAFYIQDIENILEIFSSFDYDVYKKDIYNWKVKCVGPPPITNTSKNLANTFNRVLNNE